MPTGDQGRRPPAHAGRLRPWEQFAIALVLALMTAVVVVIMVSGGRTPHPAGPQVPAQPGSPAAVRPAVQGSGRGSTASAGSSGFPSGSGAKENKLLAAALAPVLRHRSGNLAVGVVDSRTGAMAAYNGSHLFHAAGIARADILAALLFQHQRAGTPLSDQERQAATAMIEDGDDEAADALWDAAGEAAGLRAANRLLRLSQTTPGAGMDWGLSSTTVGDQLQLLTDLTSRRSPLSAASRSYELGLLRQVPVSQAWGATAAATPGTSPAVTDGWLPDGSDTTWVVSSIGVISHAGHTILIAVLSDDQPTETAGITQDEAAAHAAASAITGG